MVIIFRANAKFFRQKPGAKNEKNVFIKRKKEFIPPREMKCLKSGVFKSNYWAE